MSRLIRQWFASPRFATWFFRLYPPFLFTATQVTRIAPDWTSVQVRMALWLTRNIVGTQFGGALYAMCDPWFMLMLMQRLGPDFIVWDKAATIHFRRPGRGTVYATFAVTDEQVAAIRQTLATQRKMDAIFHAQVCDKAGEVVADVEKVIYVRRKGPLPTFAGAKEDLR